MDRFFFSYFYIRYEKFFFIVQVMRKVFRRSTDDTKKIAYLRSVRKIGLFAPKN